MQRSAVAVAGVAAAPGTTFAHTLVDPVTGVGVVPDEVGITLENLAGAAANDVQENFAARGAATLTIIARTAAITNVRVYSKFFDGRRY